MPPQARRDALVALDRPIGWGSEVGKPSSGQKPARTCRRARVSQAVVAPLVDPPHHVLE